MIQDFWWEDDGYSTVSNVSSKSNDQQDCHNDENFRLSFIHSLHGFGISRRVLQDRLTMSDGLLYDTCFMSNTMASDGNHVFNNGARKVIF